MKQPATDTTERERFALGIIREFGPVVGRLGFGSPRWEYEETLRTLRVQFDDPQRKKAVQIDYKGDGRLYSANYCRDDGEWQICTQRKPQALRMLKHSLTDWLLDVCEDCCLDCEPAPEVWDEDDYSLVPCSHCDSSGHVPKISA
ncbi:MAG TPA: hypothetical protein VK463_20810 [Desulfomonilaceae bacterium]|nr:hypothetical protein [Desulfomonilaceae bacterium]